MVTRTWDRSARRGTPTAAVLVLAALLAAVGGASPAPAPSITELAAVAAAAHSGTPCSSSAKACMDLSAQQAWLTDGAGHVTYGPVPAHGGSKSAKTPKGTFSVLSKDAHYFSTEFHAPMPYSVFFYPGDAFHADNPATASNGCIHLSMAAAQRFFATLRPGDQVQIK